MRDLSSYIDRLTSGKVAAAAVVVSPPLASRALPSPSAFSRELASCAVFRRIRGFRHEKTKAKRSTYRGGLIDTNAVNSIKFENDDD